MKKRILFLGILLCAFLAGCGSGSEPVKTPDVPEDTIRDITEDETSGNTEDEASISKKKKKKASKEKSSAKKSLAARMAGKYSYHYSDQDGNDEFYVLEVVPFGDNLYAFCGQAVSEDYETLEPYTFWASEFIPYDKDEITSPDGDSVTVNEFRFSVMSNAGRFWDSGCKGVITLTDDGLVFEGFEKDSFLVPEDDDSRLFLKDDRVEDTFGYLTNDKTGGDEKLQGLWILDNKGADQYLEFIGSDMYIYKKSGDSKVFFAAGGCTFSDGSFECNASRLGDGGLPYELAWDYKVSGDTLTLKFTGYDLPEGFPENARFTRIKDGDVHVITMDEVELDSGSLGMMAGIPDIDELTSREYYGVFVSSAKTPEKLESVIQKLEDAGFAESGIVYTPDFEGLNPEPYYVATTGMYLEESDAKAALSDVKADGFTDAYVKKAGKYTGDRFRYITYSSEGIEVLKDGAMLRGVTVSIPYGAGGDPVTADLFVSKDARFDSSADLDSFGNYEKGETPYEWIKRNYELMNEDPDMYLMYGPALSGVFEVGLSGNNITRYYGSYWWD